MSNKNQVDVEMNESALLACPAPPAPGNEDSDPFTSRNDHCWLDKSDYLHRMLSKHPKSKGFFLLRPRRFGKTAFVNLIKHFFQERELFKDLKIGELLAGDEWDTNNRFQAKPVLHLKMHQVKVTKLELGLAYAIYSSVRESIKQVKNSKYFLPLSGECLTEFKEELAVFDRLYTSVSPDFSAMLHQAVKVLQIAAGGRKVVVLFDEFDSHLTRCLERKKLPKELFGDLKEFYGSLKDEDSIEFSFLTGATPFLAPSQWSGLNNFIDLSFASGFDDICGITMSDLESNENYLKLMEKVTLMLQSSGEVTDLEDLKGKMMQYYNGYTWSGNSSVLNVMSVNSFLNEKKFEAYWESTANSKYVFQGNSDGFLNCLKKISEGESPSALKIIDIVDLANNKRFVFDEEDIRTVALCAGYLTVESWDVQSGLSFLNKKPKLKIPNRSATDTMLSDFFTDQFKYKRQEGQLTAITAASIEFLRTLTECSWNKLAELLGALFSSLVFHSTEGWNQKEAHYHRIMQIIFCMLSNSVSVATEVQTANGRSDLAVVFTESGKTNGVIFEFKRHQGTVCNGDEAFKQMMRGKYFAPMILKGLQSENMRGVFICFGERTICSSEIREHSKLSKMKQESDDQAGAM